MTRIQVARDADLGRTAPDAARSLFDVAFDDMTHNDRDHALGGIHGLGWEGDAVVGHASMVQCRLLYVGRALRAGHVGGVAVRADHRRRGYGAAMMTELQRIIGGAYDLGALGASDYGLPFYLRRG